MKKTYIDLTHNLNSEIPTWDGGCGFEIMIQADYQDCTPPDTFRTNKINCNAGIGTHMDSPAHMFEGKKTIEQLELKELIFNCVVIDVSKQVNESFVLMPEHIEEYEQMHGNIPKDSFVVLCTGWEKFWDEKDKYINNYKFPSVNIKTAEMLLERGISGIGVDTLSVDTGEFGFPVHRAILGSNKILVENIKNAHLIPKNGAKIFILPMKIEGATEAPIRLIVEI